MYRNVDVQIGQIASTLNLRNPQQLPSQFEVNLREQVNAITLRSGKQLENPKLDVSYKDKEKEKSEKR